MGLHPSCIYRFYSIVMLHSTVQDYRTILENNQAKWFMNDNLSSGVLSY